MLEDDAVECYMCYCSVVRKSSACIQAWSITLSSRCYIYLSTYTAYTSEYGYQDFLSVPVVTQTVLHICSNVLHLSFHRNCRFVHCSGLPLLHFVLCVPAFGATVLSRGSCHDAVDMIFCSTACVYTEGY